MPFIITVTNIFVCFFPLVFNLSRKELLHEIIYRLIVSEKKKKKKKKKQRYLTMDFASNIWRTYFYFIHVIFII